jgi:uncharacterized protein (DUF983 family)
MANEHDTGHAAGDRPARQSRDVGQAMVRGMRGRCPNCGEGRMFSRFLAVAPTCDVCGERLDGHRADDAPPYVVIMIVGHVVVALNLAFERAAEWPLWVHFAVWIPLTLILSLGLIQPTKGAIIGLQWANRMHGFGRNEADDTPMTVNGRPAHGRPAPRNP